MIGILLLGFLISAIFAGWLLIRWVASLATRRQQYIAAVLVGIILLPLTQFCSGYSLASPWGTLILLAVASAGYFLLTFLLWHKDRTLFTVALLLPAAIVALNFVGWMVVLGMEVGNASAPPTEQGRISPISTYRIVQYPGIWGGSTPPYTYEIYKNPRWLPFIWKQVDRNSVPCGPGDGHFVKGFLIKAGANDRSVVISCTEPKTDAKSWQVPID